MGHATPDQVLSTAMDSTRNDAKATNIREYLVELLAQLWQEGESFSGKRPFGNSGWDWELYGALYDAGHVKGRRDEYGDLFDVDSKLADQLIMAAIRYLGGAPRG